MVKAKLPETQYPCPNSGGVHTLITVYAEEPVGIGFGDLHTLWLSNGVQGAREGHEREPKPYPVQARGNEDGLNRDAFGLWKRS